MENEKLKIAIVHDHLGFSGGGERTVLLMALRLGADFITAYADPSVFPDYQAQLGGRLKILSKKVIYMRVVRFFWLRFLFWRRRKMFKDYDILIASSQTATEVVAHYSRKTASRIVYTHTTPRRVFDLYEISKNMYPLILRPAYAVFARYWKYIYLRAIRKFNFNIANSDNVRKRIRVHTKGDANAVVWPPIMTERFRFIESGDYYLSFGRLDEAKRIELIVEAFQKMPDQKLVIASGGPRLETIKKMADGFKNIEIKGWVNDEELVELVGRCRAAIYIPIDEDAGMTHLEANAAGKPFLGVGEGGLIESTIDGESGILLSAQPSVQAVIDGVKKMTRDWCLARKQSCEEQAKKYNEENFYHKIERIVDENDPRLPVLGLDASRWEDPRFPGKRVRTGVEIYARAAIVALVDEARKRGIRPRVYTQTPIQSLPASIQKVIPRQSGWTRLALARELRESPVKYFYTPSYHIPGHAPEKSFAMLHDVVYKSHPERYNWKERRLQDRAARLNIKRAEKIFTISEFSRQEIVRFYHLNPGKVKVVPMGYEKISNIQYPISNNNERYLLYIGRIEKKKSVDVLIRAFALFRQVHPEWRLKLIGLDGFGAEEIKKLAHDLGLDSSVDFLGYVEEEEKWGYLAAAALYAHPSSHEGSSIPILEAFDAGVPVLAADVPVIKEVGQDAVVYFKAGDPESLRNRIEFLLADENLQAANIGQGWKYLEQRSWERVAKAMLSEMLKDL